MKGLAALGAEEWILSLSRAQRADENGVILVVVNVDQMASRAAELDLAPVREKDLEVLLGSLVADSFDKVVNRVKLHGHGAVLAGRTPCLDLCLLVLQEMGQAHGAVLSETTGGPEDLLAAGGIKTLAARTRGGLRGNADSFGQRNGPGGFGKRGLRLLDLSLLDLRLLGLRLLDLRLLDLSLLDLSLLELCLLHLRLLCLWLLELSLKCHGFRTRFRFRLLELRLLLLELRLRLLELRLLLLELRLELRLE